MVDHGIAQFLDLGSGIPTVGNAHEVAQAADPTCRVTYVDNDEVAVGTRTVPLDRRPGADRDGRRRRGDEKQSGSDVFRSYDEVLAMFDGFELVEPGVVDAPQWRREPGCDDTGPRGVYVGLGRKP
jgi:hypothetical protein